MFNITDSDVKVTKIKTVSEKLVVGTAYTTHKDKDGNYIKTFIECKFVGNALCTFNELGITDKQKINVIEGSIRNEPYKKDGKEHSKLVLTVFEMQEYQER
jgi:hypothetical protein